jgi:hypothetical protein
MGAGENGTVSAPANRASNTYQATKSADSSANAKFADALSQENGNSQVRGGETKTSTVDNQMMGILNNPRLDENAKVAELRKTIADLPDAEKKDLYERLKDRKSNDPLVQQFHYRLSHHPYKAGGTSTTDQVLNALKQGKSKSQAPTQDSGSTAPGKGASPSVTDAKTADARARDPILGQDATGLKPGEQISAKLTTKQDITKPQAEMTFDFSKQITKDQAAAILFQRGKVPDGATLTQGKGNQWTVQYRNNIYAKQDVVTHMNSHTESVLTRSKLPGEMFYPEPDVTMSWVGGAKAFSTTKVEPPRRDLKNDMGFVISKHYPLDEGQSPDMNIRTLVQPGPGYEVVFDKPKTAEQVKETFFEKGVRDDQVRVIPLGKEPTTAWQVQMLDGMTPLKMPAARAIQDSNVYAKESIPPMLPDGIKAHLQNQTVPADAKRFEPDVYVWEQDGHIVRVETNGKKGDAGYYKYEETKLNLEDKEGADSMRVLMLKQGLPVREAWKEFIRYWDQVNLAKMGIVSAMSGGSFMIPRMMGGGGGVPRSAWQEPIGARSRANSGPEAGSPGSGGGNGGPKPSNTIVESPPPPPNIGNPGGGGPKPSNTIVESPPPPPAPFTGPNPAMGEKGTLVGNPPPMKPPAPGPKAPAAAPAAAADPNGKNIVPGKGNTLPGAINRKVGKPSGPPPEIPSIPKQSGAKLSKQQVYDVFTADRGRIGWSMTPEEHLRQWQNAHPGTTEPPPVAFTTRDGRVQVSEEGWIKSGEGPLWGYEPGGPSD